MAKMTTLATLMEPTRQISTQMDLCQSVAVALIETSQPWTAELSTSWRRIKTDFDKAREQTRQRIGNALTELQRVRERGPDPDAIRAEHYIRNIDNCCVRCPELNAKNIQESKPFVCFAKQLLQQGSEDPCRFQLNEEGNIVERQPR